MKRQKLPWLLAVPLMIAGSFVAHALGYLVFSPTSHSAPIADSDHGLEVVGRATHGPLTQTPLIIGLITALVLVGFARRIWTSGQGNSSREVAASWFFLLPPLAFLVQEAAERLIHAESFPFNPAHEPAFLAAFALQAPFGIIAFLFARLLLKAADALGRTLFSAREVVVTPETAVPLPLRTTARRRWAALRQGHSSRSPPLLVS